MVDGLAQLVVWIVAITEPRDERAVGDWYEAERRDRPHDACCELLVSGGTQAVPWVMVCGEHAPWDMPVM